MLYATTREYKLFWAFKNVAKNILNNQIPQHGTRLQSVIGINLAIGSYSKERQVTVRDPWCRMSSVFECV